MTREVVAAHKRPDLALRLDQALERLARPETVICVAVEFKQGKSALINALLGSEICPVIDDLATTTVTLVRYGPEPRVTVRLPANGTTTEEQIASERFVEIATQREDVEGDQRIELVEVSVPLSLLQRGLRLVDTPGVGGVSLGRAAATWRSSRPRTRCSSSPMRPPSSPHPSLSSSSRRASAARP